MGGNIKQLFNIKNYPIGFAEDRILVQQLSQLLGFVNNYVFSVLFLSILMWWSLSNTSNEPALGIWCAAVVISNLITFFHARQRLMVGISLESARRVAWEVIFLRGVEGLLWGGLPWIAMDTATLTGHVLVASVVGALIGGASSLLSPVMPIYFAYAFPEMLLIGSKFFSMGDPAFNSLGIAAILYFGAMFAQALNSHRGARTSIDLRFELADSNARLRDSEESLKEAQFMASLGSYVLDIQSGRWAGSDTIYQMHGIGRSYDHSLSALENLDHPDDRQMMRDYLQRAIEDRSWIVDISYRIIRPDNQQVRWLRALGRMSFDEAGQPSKLFGTLQDISEHRQREAELNESNKRLREIEQRQTLSQERQRLMRDMHDGLGSTLVSALRVVEHGRMDESEVAQVLKGCIDDLKLAIDSMETADADLLLLLATLRFRLEPRLESTGIALVWDVQEAPPMDWLDPKNALHILRILQEAFTNIIKHTQATEIRVATRIEDGYVVVIIEDNGQGFDFDGAIKRGGKGLSNQQRRAEAISGKVQWKSSVAGTQFSICLPIKR